MAPPRADEIPFPAPLVRTPPVEPCAGARSGAGRESGEGARGHEAQHSRLKGRERPLRLLHAWNPHPSRQESETGNAARRHLARRVLREAEERVRAAYPGLHLSDDQLEGPAIGVLVKAADEADLLVVGSRGLSGFTGFLVGSVALGVVAGASRPVVLVRAGEEASDERLPAEDGGASP
ncbi:universal stress protein, partial [Streptomyces sp. NPDC005209]|uniref:universal stress protein n=1 Tax=Streptomyces sp. NPDC005209 TaxID=3156715 RepID=UPI00339E54F5